ncbi:hypothetical protein Acr_03g0013420 [Actinidia rufa]|uniref:Uncharacterized protein n=1 Tax=Actinidia rufa TaxID=165716 RepID=A0A7J0EDL6_9ERIC|nr:hypothetical protein Acr_03g0013420 [Actinidia rufa]
MAICHLFIGEAREESASRIPGNVKDWKKRFFFASGDEWEFFPSMPVGQGIPRVVNSGKSCNALPALTETKAKRTAEVLGKIEPGVISMCPRSWAPRPSRNTLSSSVWRYPQVAGITSLRATRAFLDTPDMALLRWLGEKVQDSFTNLFPKGSDSSSDSRSESLSDSELPPELRYDAVSTQISPFAPTQKAGEKAATKEARMKATPQPPSKRVVIQEKHPQEGDYAAKKGELDSSKGKKAMLPLPPERFKSNKGAINTTMRTSVSWTSLSLGDDLDSGVSMMSSAHVARKVLDEAIPPADKEKAEQSSSKDLVIKFFHTWGQTVVLISSLALRTRNRALKAEGWLAELSEQAAKSSTESAKLEVMARLEAKVAITDSTATYFSDGFEFCKRQLLHHYPNLGLDVASMEMDASFAEEEEEAKEGKKEVGNEGGVAPAS